MVTILEDRLLKLQGLSLKKGAHSPNSTFCVMEAVAFVAGEKWSDAPECACPIISAFLRSWNDALPTDAERDRWLKPLIPQLVNTRNKDLEEKRGCMAADWLIRTHTPAWLRLAGLSAQADTLANLPEIIVFSQLPSLRGPIEAVRNDAAGAGAGWAAAGAAAGAAWVAGRDAAWAAGAGAAAGAAAAAWAAGDAAGAAAGDAAWAAAGDAAWAAARDAAGAAAAAGATLAPAVANLQVSALELVERMLALR